MVAIILFGSSWGKYFVTFCVLVSQINMAYNDTVTDALTVQASKKGVQDGTENLNAICYFMQAIGAIAGAFMSMFVTNTKELDCYQCFGIYLALQSLFFMSAYCMNKSLEPGEIKAYKEIQKK